MWTYYSSPRRPAAECSAKRATCETSCAATASSTACETIGVVDRLGSGDAYVAGVLYGLLRTGDPAKALQFGNAASAVKNTIPGDLPSSDLAEITAIIRSHQSTGPQSEMNR